LVDPITRAPLELKDGAVGEAIHTALEYQAAPAFRNATGDILRLHVGECPGCGHFGTRMEIIGRADDLLNVKGVKVYPTAIQDVVATFQPHVSGQLRIRLSNPPPRVVPIRRNPIGSLWRAASNNAPANFWPCGHRCRWSLSALCRDRAKKPS